MAVDIRATVTCSLGTLISASISDDYIQGSGLIKTKGNCELSGLYNPPTGTVVTFAYTKDGITRTVPRKLRVLSSFADPFRRTTKVELGCKLTYLQDLKDRLEWDAFDDPLNATLTEGEDDEIVTIPIYASSVMNQCLLKLGIAATSIPLTNKFSVAEFDYSPGYVQILSDLLVSESYCAYLDYEERLQVFFLFAGSSTGPVVDQSKLIDIGSLGFGQMPGDAVTVSFSSLRLKASVEPEQVEGVEDPDVDPVAESPPDPEEDPEAYNEYVERRQSRDWELNISQGSLTAIALRYPSGSVLYYYVPTTVVQTDYVEVDGQDQIRSEIQISDSIAAADFGSYLVSLINGQADVTVNGSVPTQSITTTNYTYSRSSKTVERIESEPFAKVFGSMNLPFTFGELGYVILPSETIPVRRTVSITEVVGNVSRTVTTFYKLWHETISGQQAIAEGSFNFENPSQVASYVNFIAQTGPVYAGTETSTQLTTLAGTLPPARPPLADRINQDQAEEPTEEEDALTDDPFIPEYSTPSVSEVVLASGSSLAERRIELSMPYAPDDRFIRGGQIPDTDPPRYRYYAIRSDADVKAKNYGVIQNRILLGNRYGMNIQTAPELIPATPFAPFYISANGTVSQYRANGTSWTMDSNGIVASTDALYWGVVGQAP